MLKEKKPRLKLTEIVLVHFGSVAESAEPDLGRIVTVNEERSGMDYLLGRDRHVRVDDRTGLSFLEIPIELGATQIRKDQRLLNHLWRRREDRHRALFLLDHLPD